MKQKDIFQRLGIEVKNNKTNSNAEPIEEYFERFTNNLGSYLQQHPINPPKLEELLFKH